MRKRVGWREIVAEEEGHQEQPPNVRAETKGSGDKGQEEHHAGTAVRREDEGKGEDEEQWDGAEARARNLGDGAVDALLSIAAGVTCCTPLAEQDIWWQVRLGDELWQGRGMPSHEEWSYTSTDKPFHNHW